MRKLITLLCFTFISMTAHASPTSQDLFNTINQRLSYMEDVALFKALNHKAIEDSAREVMVVDKAKAAAAEKGLKPEQVESFFKAQIAVAKAIQYRHRADWLSQPAERQPRDLQTEIRPALITLGAKITQQLADYVKENGEFTPDDFDTFNSAITVKYVTARDKQMLFLSLMEIKNNS